MKKNKREFSGFRSILSHRVKTATRVLLLILTALSLASFVFQPQHKHADTVSPLLFGTNIGLFNAQDSFLTQKSVRDLVRKMHISTLRIPVRQVSDNAGMLWPQAVQEAKNLGLIPLLILPISANDPGALNSSGQSTTSQQSSNSIKSNRVDNHASVNDPATLVLDRQIVETVHQIMGNNRVFYELGNEEDLSNGMDQYHYTAKWNWLVPSLKRFAPNAWFGGPVTYQSNVSYVAYFYHHAQPRPDFISWHAYFCDPQSSIQTCIGNVAHFSIDMENTKSAIQANNDSVPPIFITEWNYDASQGANSDPRDTPQFQKQFVQTVLQEFAKDGVYAAYHYVLNSNPAFNLINTNNTTLTPAGQEFPTMYKQIIGIKPGTPQQS